MHLETFCLCVCLPPSFAQSKAVFIHVCVHTHTGEGERLQGTQQPRYNSWQATGSPSLASRVIYFSMFVLCVFSKCTLKTKQARKLPSLPNTALDIFGICSPLLMNLRGGGWKIKRWKSFLFSNPLALPCLSFRLQVPTEERMMWKTLLMLELGGAGGRAPCALPSFPSVLRYRSSSAIDQHHELARERSKTVTSFYNQSAIDIAAEKVSANMAAEHAVHTAEVADAPVSSTAASLRAGFASPS